MNPIESFQGIPTVLVASILKSSWESPRDAYFEKTLYLSSADIRLLICQGVQPRRVL